MNGIDDVGANQGETAKAAAVDDSNSQGRAIHFLFRQLNVEEFYSGAKIWIFLRIHDNR